MKPVINMLGSVSTEYPENIPPENGEHELGGEAQARNMILTTSDECWAGDEERKVQKKREKRRREGFLKQ